MKADYRVVLSDRFTLSRSPFTLSWVLEERTLGNHYMPRDLSPRLARSLLREWSRVVGLRYEDLVQKIEVVVRAGVPGQIDPKPEFRI